MIQSIWSASLGESEPLSKPLYSDAGSGIVFNFDEDVLLGDVKLPLGVVALPVSQCAQTIHLSSFSLLCGIRFLPAIGYGVIGRHFDKPTLLPKTHSHYHSLHVLYEKLATLSRDEDRVLEIERWAANYLDITHAIPDSLAQSMSLVSCHQEISRIGDEVALSQRQIERQFKRWLGMTPKYFQRVLRVKKTVEYLKQNSSHNLASVAADFGYSDQAHMTRELSALAHITPGELTAK